MLPTARDEFSRHAAWHDNGVATRQTNLTAVGVPAEHELKSRSGGFGESLGAVRKQDRAFVWRNAGPGFGEVVGF
jgi:hypothetical protein